MVQILQEAYGADVDDGVEEEEPVGIDQDTLQAIVKREIDDAVDFIEHSIGPQRAESARYYRGDRYGNEDEGRSQVVTRDVRDSVRQVLPSLLKVFFGSERAVEFVPEGPEDVAMAEQATDYVNYVLRQDNPGFSVGLSAFKDALYAKVGIIKYWRDESIEVTYHEFTGLDDAALGSLLGEQGVELTEISSTDSPQGAAHEVQVRRTRRTPKIRVAAVPPDEFLIDRKARDIDTARYVGHRSLKTFSELIALGYDPETIESHVTSSGTLGSSVETYTRYSKQGGYWPTGDTLNDGEREILYVESYVRVDMDGDGISELCKICTMGDGYEVVDVEKCAERPFASFCIDPEPHLFFGDDLADVTKDLQLITSSVLRNVLDSLAMSIHPRTAIVEGQVNLEDALNTEIGTVIRMNAPGMVTPFALPFVGAQAFPMLEFLKAERTERVGVHNMALDSDTLQSTTKAAVNAQVEGARQQLEMIARIFAEVGMKRLFRGLLKLVVAHQDKPRTVRLRNEWVTVDPATWNSSMDVSVNVGLGNGLAEERLAVLNSTLSIQREILTTMGMDNPLVGLGQVRNTLSKMLTQSGFKDTAQFFKPLPVDYEPEPQPPKPDPAEMLAQVEMAKIQADIANDQARLDLDRDKLNSSVLLEVAKIEAEWKTQVDVLAIKASMAANTIV